MPFSIWYTPLAIDRHFEQFYAATSNFFNGFQEIFKPNSGDGVDNIKDQTDHWPFYDDLSGYMLNRDVVLPPVVINSGVRETVVFNKSSLQFAYEKTASSESQSEEDELETSELRKFSVRYGVCMMVVNVVFYNPVLAKTP